MARTARHKPIFPRLHRLLRNERGAVAIEFGLLALPFFALLGAIMQTALVFLTTEVFDSAVKDASRQIRTGQVQDANFDIEQFRSLVCDHTFGLMDCSRIFFRVSEIGDFASATSEAPVDPACEEDCDWTDEQTFGPGVGSQVVLVEAYYRQPIIINLGLDFLTNMSDGTRLLASVHLFKNEPF